MCECKGPYDRIPPTEFAAEIQGEFVKRDELADSAREWLKMRRNTYDRHDPVTDAERVAWRMLDAFLERS
jgi:hypothetical protein